MSLRLVVADDNDVYRAGILRAAASAPDIELVAEATGGWAALEAIRRLGCDVALVDLRMPEGDGHGVCRAVAELEPATRPAVVVMTAADDPGLVELTRLAGGAVHISKALSRREILQVVRDVCRRSA